MDAPGSEIPGAQGSSRILWWVALTAALSPVVWGWLAFLIASPAKRPALLFLPLLVVLALRAPTGPGRSRGLLWVAGAVLLEWSLLAGGLPRFARVALPIGVLGLAEAQGAPPWRVAALSLWWLPLPAILDRSLAPATLEALVATVGPLIGSFVPALTLDAQGASLAAQESRLLFARTDAGLDLLWWIAGLLWAVTTLPRAAWPVRFAGLAVLALASVPLRFGAAVGSFAVGLPDLARAVLDHAGWLVVGIGLTALRRPGDAR